jgi:predicted enzyme related to lactoylglutathione lyase
MPRVIHFEIGVDEPDRAIDFYSGVFGWKVDKWEGPQSYWMVSTGDNSQFGIDGAFSRRVPDFPPTTNIIEVDSVDAYSGKIVAGGGKMIHPKNAIPGVGYAAYFQDTEGNICGIFQADKNAGKT